MTGSEQPNDIEQFSTIVSINGPGATLMFMLSPQRLSLHLTRTLGTSWNRDVYYALLSLLSTNYVIRRRGGTFFGELFYTRRRVLAKRYFLTVRYLVPQFGYTIMIYLGVGNLL